MTLRGARILLWGAGTMTGRSLVEAFLALGAQVVAADRLRTELEELRAHLRQHERLWVAEADLNGPEAAAALFLDVARDEPIDAAILVEPAGARRDGAAQALPAGMLGDAARTLPRCDAFLRAALMPKAGLEHGRVLVVLEPSEYGFDPGLAAAAEELVARTTERLLHSGSGVAVAGLGAPGARAALLERVTALCDRSQPAVRGWQREG